MRLVILVCFLFSGVAGLIYEVVWTRQLTLIFGSTTLAVSISLAAYLGGMAAGSFVFGRFADRWRRLAGAYGAMELGIGLYGLASAKLLSWAAPVPYAIERYLAIPPALGGLVQFAAVLLLLLPPTMLMGGTLPVLVRADSLAPYGLGARVGRLYAANTAGAVVGAALAGFVLLPRIGLQSSLLTAAGINVALGLLVLWTFRNSFVDRPAPGTGTVPTEPDTTAAPIPIAIAGVVVVVSGFCALFYEVIWTRALQLAIGNSTQAFSLMLATFLAGLSAGIWLSGRLARRRFHFPRLLWLIQVGIGVTVFVSVALIQQLPDWFLVLYGRFGAAPALFTMWQAILCAAVLFVPSLLMGMVFPLVLECAKSPEVHEGWQVGRLYALNTAATITGALAAGLIMIPTFGLRHSLLVGVWLNLGLAALLLWRLPGTAMLARAPEALACLLTAGLLGFWAPHWNPQQLTSGTYLTPEKYFGANGQQYRSLKAQQKLLYFREGANGTVTVRGLGPNRILNIDGRAEGNTDSIAQVLMGHLPFLFERPVEDLIVIGMGTGTTAGIAATYPVRAVDVVELEPAVVEAASFFENINHRPLANPKVHVHVADARTYLRAADPSSCDVIVSQPSTPWVSGAAKLFTAEFYELARSRLRPQGILVQWVQLYRMDLTAVMSLLRTFSEAFPQSLAFEVGRRSGELILVGSPEPVALSWEALEALYAEPARAAELARVHIEGAGGILAQLIFGPSELAAAGQGRPLNTDDNGLLEFSAKSTIYKETTEQNMTRLRRSAIKFPWKYVTHPPAGSARQRTLVEMARNALHRLDFVRGLGFAETAVRLKDTIPALRILGDIQYVRYQPEKALAAWMQALKQDPANVSILRRLVRHYDRPEYQWASPNAIIEWRSLLAAAGDPLGRTEVSP